MKNNPNLDELLNGYIDGELTDRQRIELQRLISNDTNIARKLEQLRRCKMLVGALPHAEAPADMLRRVKASLESQTFLGPQMPRFDNQAGARQLLFRKVLTAAAMIALIAVLGTVIYTIVAPDDAVKPVAMDRPTGQPDTPTFDKPKVTVASDMAIAEFNGTLQFTTASATVAEAVVKAIQANGLLAEFAPANRLAKGPYSLNCTRTEMELLMADLEDIWHEFDSAKLFLDGGATDRTVFVEDLTIEQLSSIINQPSPEKRIRQAKDFAFLNYLAANMPAEDLFQTVQDRMPPLTIIPKPRLTGREEAISKTTITRDHKNIYLTIIIDTPQFRPGAKPD